MTALLPRRGRGGPGQVRIAGDREAIMSEIIDTQHLTRQKLRPSEIVRIINARCHKEGISAPSEATIRRRPRSISREVVSKNRELQPQTKPIVGATPIPEFPLDLLQMDHTLVDIILVDAIERAPIGRPYLTLAIDIMSRAIAGFYLSLDAPSATSVGLCLTHVATDKASWMAERDISDVAWPIMGKPKALGVPSHGLQGQTPAGQWIMALIFTQRRLREVVLNTASKSLGGGPVPLWCRPKFSFKRLFFRKPRGFSSLKLSACGGDCKSR